MIAAVPTPLTHEPADRSYPARDSFSVLIPRTAYTWHGFRRWARVADLPSYCRVSFVDGSVFIDTSLIRLNSHVAVRGAIASTLYGLVGDFDLGLWVCGRIPVSHEGAELSTEPDGAFISYASLRSGRVRLVPTDDGLDTDEIEGSPDMVCEIVSPATAERDAGHLKQCYHRAGIPEYWLIDARGHDLRFDLFRYTPTTYEPTPAADGWLSSTVFARRFRLDRTRDRADLWQYTLHVAPLDAPAT